MLPKALAQLFYLRLANSMTNFSWRARQLSSASVVVGGFLAAIFALPQVAQAAPCPATAIRWASTSNNLYVAGSGVTCTLTEIDAIATKAPLTQVAPNVWLLGANLILQQGATLPLKGTSVGGDVNELRLKSNSSGTNPTVYLRADWGNVLMESTKVTSWDEAANGPDTNSGSRRSFIHVRSSLGSDGTTARESRMDIKNSDVGYLGHYAAESYGLVWKVSGTNIPGLYDKVNVLGDVVNSRIHHNYFGAYTYGAYGMLWDNNEIDNNAQYGLDPHDDSDSLTITNNDVHHNGNHGIICSQRCDTLTITNNHAYNNVGNGIMLHRNANLSLVQENEVNHNGDSGIAIFDSHKNTIKNNNSHHNKKGLRFSVGSSDNVITDNTVAANTNYGLYFYKGSDAPTSGDGKPKNNQFINNDITGSKIYGLKMKEADNNLFKNNRFITNGESLLVETSVGNEFENNNIRGNKTNGLVLSGATGHRVTGNLIESNGNVGVLVKSASNNAVITGNTIRNHTQFGIRVQSSSSVTTSPNTFSNNGTNVGS